MKLRCLLLVWCIIIYQPSPVDSRNLIMDGGGVPSAGGTACSNADMAPSADEVAGNWAITGTTSNWDAIRVYAGQDDIYIGQYASGSGDYDVVRFTMPGDCNISQVVVNIKATSGSGDANDGALSVSSDNTTYAEDQTFSGAANWSPTDTGRTFSVSYTTPSYVYVRFKGTSSTNSWLYIRGMEISIN